MKVLRQHVMGGNKYAQFRTTGPWDVLQGPMDVKGKSDASGRDLQIAFQIKDQKSGKTMWVGRGELAVYFAHFGREDKPLLGAKPFGLTRKPKTQTK